MNIETIREIPNGAGQIKVKHDRTADYILVYEQTSGMTLTREYDLQDHEDVLQLVRYLSSIAYQFSSLLLDELSESLD